MPTRIQPYTNPISTLYQLRYNRIARTPITQTATKHDLGALTIEITNLKIGDSLPAMDKQADYFDKLK